ncbi:uncharacterized protein LOC127263560 isoform X2 [Andrographis paniculata]|uniref:uncharacterized protein LOC127263560 isoform X2 n=1 Tax=Andrographis paniculata TaxID=175694 RepID=UPI0021E8FCF7|nr:uncharacterized protein LOC127263560 isoform X2 [Andrographis paniculata]
MSDKSVMALKDNVKPFDDINNLHVSAAPAPEIAMDPRRDVPSGTFRDIDCNLPLVSRFKESHLPRPSDFLPSSVGLGSKRNENAQTGQTQCRDSNHRSVDAAVDKGKSAMESEPASGNSSRTTYLQVRCGNILLQLQPRKAFHDFMAPSPNRGQSFARQRMMPRDLADQGQSWLLHATPVSQVRYANPILNPFPPDHVSSLLLHPQANGNFPIDEFQLSLGNPY